MTVPNPLPKKMCRCPGQCYNNKTPLHLEVSRKKTSGMSCTLEYPVFVGAYCVTLRILTNHMETKKFDDDKL